LRDLPNLVAFGPGAFHFLPRQEWLRLAEKSNFSITEELRVTPFVRIFFSVKLGDSNQNGNHLMLFSIKNKLVPTLLLSAGFSAISLWLRQVFGLSWNLNCTMNVLQASVMGLAVVVVINAGLHKILEIIWGEPYLARCRLLLAHFQSQRTIHFLAGGFLAATEEMIFRGVLLESLMSKIGLGSSEAIILSALAFGAAHVMPDRRLAPFSLWAFLEGIFLGILYVKTHSLSVVILAHFVNDTCGYALFALERKTGWLLREGANP
jgi:membrane protease YdiL (CAAX protease family)